MTRIASLAASTALVNQILNTQRRIFDAQSQVASEKKSQEYSGIAEDSERLVNLENTKLTLDEYIRNNETERFRLNIANTALGSIRETIKEFRDQLSAYKSGGLTDKTNVANVQEAAHRALIAMEGFLNTEADGRFMFSGARVRTEPVNFGLSTIAAFQSTFDGAAVTFPTTRDAHLAEFSLDENPSTEAANWLTFVRDNGGTPPRGRVTATAASFSNVKVGGKITISGTGSANDGTYTVAAVTSTTIDIQTEMLTDEAATAAPTLTDVNNNKLTSGNFGTLTFARAAGTIVAATGGAFAKIKAGEVITVAGSTSNNGSYTVSSNDGTTITIVQKRFTDFGSAATTRYFDKTVAMTFADNTPSADTIAAAAGTFDDGSGNPLPAGAKITISGTLSNNGTFTIASTSTDGSTITLVSTDTLTAEVDGAATGRIDESAGTIAAAPYYAGDQVSITHRIDDLRSFEIDFTAVHPSFEKAIRAMGIIAQGVFQTDGGLDQNEERIGQAQFLLTSATEATVTGTPPFGSELSGSLEELEQDIGFNQILINDTSKLHKDFIAFIDQRVADVENVNLLDVITRILDDQRSLEASFQVFARIRQLSLTNFI